MAYENSIMISKRFSVRQNTQEERNLNPDVISIAWGYQIEVFAQRLNTPIGMAFTEDRDMLIADAGVATGNPQVLLLSNGQLHLVADGFNVPITGINYHNGSIYVSHRGVISVIKENGAREDIISGLPSFGDYSNNRVEISSDNKIYFGQGTATNSGVVGLDNKWIVNHPYFCDFPGSPILLKGNNYSTKNVLIPAASAAYTGAFSPFGVPNNYPFEIEKGRVQASGSVLRANLDGSNLSLVAWGLRNPFQVKFDSANRLIVANQGLDDRGSRPIANGLDELSIVRLGAWYGWPDYVAGEPVSMARFKPITGEQPQLLLETIPGVPPFPIATFPTGANVMGFDFNNNENFGPKGDAYIAQFGRVQYEAPKDLIPSGVGHRIVRVNMRNGEVSTFAINKSGFPQGAGLGRPTDVVFGPDGAMYVSDFSWNSIESLDDYLPNSGVIWKITKR